MICPSAGIHQSDNLGKKDHQDEDLNLESFLRTVRNPELN